MVVDNEMPELLCRVNFPLYNVNMISPRHVMLSGGGGAANTGVRNGFVSITLAIKEHLSSYRHNKTDLTSRSDIKRIKHTFPF